MHIHTAVNNSGLTVNLENISPHIRNH